MPPPSAIRMRELPDRPFSNLTTLTQLEQSRFSNDTIGNKTPLTSSSYSSNGTNKSGAGGNNRWFDNQEEEKEELESIDEIVFERRNDRERNDSNGSSNNNGINRRVSHGRSGSMGSIKLVVNENYKGGNNSTATLRSIRDGTNIGNGRSNPLTHRRSSSTPPIQQQSSSSSTSSSPSLPLSTNHLSPFQPKVLPFRSISPTPVLSNVNGASPSTLRVITKQEGKIKVPIAVPFNDSPDTPPATIVSQQQSSSTSSLPTTLTATTIAQFRCHLIKAPSAHSVRIQSNAALFVTLNIGGTKFTTTIATILREDGQGGKLGEFLESVLEDVRKDIKVNTTPTVVKKSGLKDLVMSQKNRRGDSLDSTYPETVQELNQFNLPDDLDSPLPSPFSYDQYADEEGGDRLDSRTLSLSTDAFNLNDSIPDSPTTVEPRPNFISFVKPSSALNLSSSTTQPLRPFNSKFNKATKLDLEDLGELDDWTPQGKNYFSTYNQEMNPFEKALGPFFEVMKGQHKVVLEGEEVVERESLTLPGNVEGRMEVEEEVRKRAIERILRSKDSRKSNMNNSRNSRAVSKRGGAHKSHHFSTFSYLSTSPPPPLPNFVPSLPTFPLSTLSSTEPTEIFLDRSSDTYNSILHYLRNGDLPPELSLPLILGSSPPSIDPTTLSIFSLNPSAALALLSALRTLKHEAVYLGMKELSLVCDIEKEKVVEMVKVLEGMSNEKEVNERKRKELEFKSSSSKGVNSNSKVGWI